MRRGFCRNTSGALFAGGSDNSPMSLFHRITFVDSIRRETVWHNQNAHMRKAHSVKGHEGGSNVGAKAERAAAAIDDETRRARLCRRPLFQIGHALRGGRGAVKYGARDVAAIEERTKADIKNCGVFVPGCVREFLREAARFDRFRRCPRSGVSALRWWTRVAPSNYRQRKHGAKRETRSPLIT